ncbi:MAG: AAA family ATPase [Candidatus Thermoplasmatota archaeon]|nr:AAA family ATPase [Candidatus Thermoplasmatota archaeon]
MAATLTRGRRQSYYKKKFFFSIRERILLHLSEYGIYENEMEAPDELTQFGIAEVVLAGRSTCSKILQEMEERGLLYGRRAHVPSGKIRRTVYFLTPRGQMEAQKIRQRVEETTVKVLRPSGELQRLRVTDIPRELPIHSRLVDVVCHIRRGVLDEPTFVKAMSSRRKKVAYLGAMPRLRHFFGRAKEQETLREWYKAPRGRILVLHGLPGVGKTTLAAKFVTDLREDTNVFWYRFREWSTLRSVVHDVGEFLAHLGKKELLMYVETHEHLDIPEVLFLLEKNLQGIDALLVFDDYERAEGLDGHFAAWKDFLEKAEGPRLLVLSRVVPKFYDPRDVRVKRLVREVRLGGLDRGGATTLLALKNIPESAVPAILKATKGHPLFLELMQGPDVTDHGDFDAFLQDQVFGRLLGVERRTLGLASVFRGPIHADALFLDEDVDYVTLTSLVDQSLLRELTPKTYDMHELIRRFFAERLTPSSRKRYHRWAARFYTARAGLGDLVATQFHHLQAGSPSSAARVAIRHGRELIDGGYLEEFGRILETLQNESLNPQTDVRIRLLAGRIQDVRGEWDDAEVAYREVARLAKGGSGSTQVEAEACRLRGELLLNRGAYVKAETELRRSLKLYARAKDREGQAAVHYSLGFIQNRTCEFMEAYRSFRRGMRLLEADGDPAIRAKILYGFGVNYGQRGNYRKSVSYKLRARDILEESRDLRWLAKVYAGLGTSYSELGDATEAERYTHRAIEYARLIGDQRVLAYALQNSAGEHIARGDLDRSEEAIREASGIFQRIGEERKIGWSYLYEGSIAYLRGNEEEAEKAWQTGLHSLNQLADLRGVALFQLTIATDYFENGDLVSGMGHLDQAERFAKKIDNQTILERISEERGRIEALREGERVPRGHVVPGTRSS